MRFTYCLCKLRRHRKKERNLASRCRGHETRNASLQGVNKLGRLEEGRKEGKESNAAQLLKGKKIEQRE